MILEINPSFVEMNDLMGVFCTAGEREALGLIIQRQQQPGGRARGKSSLGSDLQAVLHLAPQKGQLRGHGEDPADLSSRAPRTEAQPPPPPGSLRVWIFLLLILTLWSACSGNEPFE